MKLRSIAIIILFISSIVLAGNKPYVILVSFDGFRWDYLNRGISPNLEKLRKEGASASSLRPSFPSITFPNHLSIITGMYPAHHGILSNNFDNPFDKTYYNHQDTSVTKNSKWYLGEDFWETAERQGITTASYFWPGSELYPAFRSPTYHETYEHTRAYEKRVEGVINWLQLPIQKRPHFITAYFHETDSKGHRFGPDAPETNEAIKRLDDITGLLMKRLDDIKMKDSVDVIFVSDHGMTEISHDRVINVEKILGQADCKFIDFGPMMHIDAKPDEIKRIYELLKKNEKNFKVYLKEETPEYYHYNDHPFIPPIVIIADLGWSLITNKEIAKLSKEGKGTHGYDNNQLDMHGIFIATGPDFKKYYRTGTLWNIDIYPLLCKIFKIYPRSNIDGKAERIEFLLNN